MRPLPVRRSKVLRVKEKKVVSLHQRDSNPRSLDQKSDTIPNVVKESLHIKCVPQSGTYLLWFNYLKADKIFPHVVRKNPYPFRP